MLILITYVFFLNLFLFHSFGSLAFGLISFGTFLYFTFTLKSNSKGELSAVFGTFIALLFFSSGIILRANIFIQVILVLAVITTLLVYGYILSTRIPMVRSLFELLLAPLNFIGAYISSLFKTINIVANEEYKKTQLQAKLVEKNLLIKSTLIGLSIGFLIIGVLISMFSSADPIFATFIKNIFSAGFLQNIPMRVFFTLLLAFIFVPFIILKRNNIFNSPINIFKKINFVHEMTLIMALVALVIGLFLAIQWPYVFVKVAFEVDLSKFGVATYSEYVRRGFGELLKIALFVYGLIWAGLLILRENKSNNKTALKFVQGIVLVEFIIFILSIFRRVWLYQEFHGWSLIRIYGSFFLFWIFGITIFLALRHFWQRRWVFGEIFFTVLILFIIGIFNVESFIVNNHPPTVNKKIDYIYLARMSADGYEGWEKAYEHAKSTLNKYENVNSQFSREELKEIAYAGIIIRELLQNHKDLTRELGTKEEMKQYLNVLLNYLKGVNAQRELYEQNNTYYQSVKNNIEEIKKQSIEDKVNLRKLIDFVYINKSSTKYEFNSPQFFPSFVEIPTYGIYFRGQIKADGKNINYSLDNFYSWNYSKNLAYKNLKEKVNYYTLLQFQTKYFNLYRRILNQSERDYDMDVSLDSPLLD